MSRLQELEERVAAFNRGDFETWLDGFTDDVEFIAARSAVEGIYHGRDGVRRFLADNQENFELFEPRLTEVREVEDSQALVLGSIRIRSRQGGVETDVPVAAVASFDDNGKITRWEDFRERGLALDALGLEP